MIAFFKRHLDAKWIEIERDVLLERNEELARKNDDLNSAVYAAREERNKLHKEFHDLRQANADLRLARTILRADCDRFLEANAVLKAQLDSLRRELEPK